MKDPELWIVEGREAADEILRGVFRIDLAKALDPTNDTDFITISTQLARAMRGVARAEEGAALKAAVQALDVDWTTITVVQRDRVIEAARASLEPVAELVLPKMELKLTATGEKVVQGTRVAIARDYDLAIHTTFDEPDRVAVNWMVEQQTLFIRNEYGRRVVAASEEARKIVASGLERGLGSEDIVEELAEGLADQTVNRSLPYLQVVADAYVGRARTYTNVHSFEEAGIETYEFMAVLDEVTTDICRCMNGRIFKVRAATDLYAKQSRLKDPEQIKNTMPWARTGTDDEGQRFLFVQDADGTRHKVADITRSGVGEADDEGEYENEASEEDLTEWGLIAPPLHGRCRSSLIPG